MTETDVRASTPDTWPETMKKDASIPIRRVRDLRIQGRYSEAVTELEELIAKYGPDISLVLELGDTLFIQGYFIKAIELLEKYMASNNVRDLPAFAAAQLILLFSQFFATAQFQILLGQAQMIYTAFHSGPYNAVIDDATVRIETYYCKFCHLAARCGLLDDTHIRNKLLPRLQTIFHILFQQEDFFNALSVARAYNVCEGPGSNSLVEHLATSERIPSLCRAHAWMILAKALTSDDQRPKQTDLYARARKQFQDGNHVHGALDANIAIACRLPFDPAADGVEADLTDIFNSYKALNYPTGYAEALLSLLHLAHGLHNFQQESVIVSELELLYPVSTSKLLWLMFQVSTLARRSVSGAGYGKIVHGGEALWNELVDSDCKFFRGQAAQLVSQAYLALKDRDKMALWSQRAEKDLSHTDLTAIPSLVKDFDLNTHEGLTSCYRMVRSLVDPSSPDYSPEIAVEKIDIFLNQVLTHVNRDQRSLDIIEAIIKVYEENVSRLTDQKQAPLFLAKLRESQAALLILRASSRQDIELELAALGPAKEAKDNYLKSKELGRAVIALQREALLNLGIAQKFQKAQNPQERLAWETAVKQYKVAFESSEQLGLTFLARENAYWVAYCNFRQWTRGWCSSEVVLKSLHVAEGFVDRHRQELSILRKMAAAIAKGRLSSDDHNRNIYRIAIKICNSTSSSLDAWNWVQRSKARSLSDMLGLGVFIPHELITRINEDATCRGLFETEQHLVKHLLAAPDTERFKCTANLEDHQKLMRKEAALAELLDLREGAPITMNDLSSKGTDRRTEGRPERATLFIDWVASEWGLSLYVVKQGEIPIMRELPISIDDVKEWTSQYLSGPNGVGLTGMLEEDEPDEGPLRVLDTLIAPLIELSSAGDLLVLCPTDILHALPLHALRLGSGDDREMLIERNPVIYCASLTSFVQCCRRADMETTAESKVENSILAVYEPDPETENHLHKQFSREEQRQIYESADRLAGIVRGEALCGGKVSTQSFKDSLERAGILHFIGHCDYTGELVTEQSLRLSGEELDKQGEFRTTSVTVKDLFDFKVKVSHVSLLACASATQKFEPGDEPLGLVTAFLAAGATSVLGTIWPVQSSAARLFSEYFYCHLASSAENNSEVYDLAYAAREAILDLKQHWEFRQPYYWAPFVLHGTWFVRGDLGLVKA